MANKYLLIAAAVIAVAALSAPQISGQGITEPAAAGVNNFIVYLLQTVLGLSASGVGFYIPGFNGTVNAGSDALPSNLDCEIPTTQAVACRVCNSDCLAVHNTYGGPCGPNKRANAPDYAKTVCYCEDNPPASGYIEDTTARCGLLPFAELDPLTDAAIGTALIARELAALCVPAPQLINGTVTITYVETGCDSDCKVNHQYDFGHCKVTTPVNRYPHQYDNSTLTQLFCICGYSNGDPTTYPNGTATNIPLNILGLGR